MIDFEYTAQDGETIEYQNFKGEVVKTYPFEDLYQWIYKEYHHVKEADLPNYIDDNWIKLTTEFYNHLNPNYYKANGHPNQLNSKKL